VETCEVVPATVEHARELAASMRAADAAEVMAASGFTPEQALLDSLKVSRWAFAVYADGEILAVWGVREMESVAVAWMLTGTAVERHRRAFWRTSKATIAVLRQHYAVIVNAVDARYAQALRWAARLGFEIDLPVPFGVAGLPFCRITMRGS
jgi:hypothetical protein